jgi:hypothetical protein
LQALESKDAEIQRLREVMEGAHGIAGAVAFAFASGPRANKARRGVKKAKKAAAAQAAAAGSMDGSDSVVEVDDVMLGGLVDAVCEDVDDGEGYTVGIPTAATTTTTRGLQGIY